MPTRALWVDLARCHGVPIRGVHLTAPLPLCEHNNAVRALNDAALFNPERRTLLPGTAFRSVGARFAAPDAAAEGFQDVLAVPFRFRGTAAQRAVWGMYWT